MGRRGEGAVSMFYQVLIEKINEFKFISKAEKELDSPVACC